MSNQDMGIALTDTFVIAALSLGLTQAPRASPQALEPVTDPDAYTIYAALLPAMLPGSRASKEVLLVQQETVGKPPCSHSKPAPDAEWAALEKNFNAENARVRLLLRPLLQLDIPYRLVPRAEIAADYARLALKYPGQWQHRPGEMEYASVSAVGFNANKTKAIVYVTLPETGELYWLEKREGKWVRSTLGGCHWAA